MHHSIIIGLTTALGIFGVATPSFGQGKPALDSPKLSPFPVTSNGTSILYMPSLFQSWKSDRMPRLTMQENGTDIPFDVAPEHTKFTFRVRPSKYLPESELDNFGKATVEIIPLFDKTVPNFDIAYPDLANIRSNLIKHLKGPIPKVKPGSYLPDWYCIDVAQTIHAQVRVTKMSWGIGFQFITEYTQEETGIDNVGLTFVFQGLSTDGKHYITILFPVSHPSLPLHAPYIEQHPGESNQQYSKRVERHYLSVEKNLDQFPEESFVPSLQTIRKFIDSVVLTPPT